MKQTKRRRRKLPPPATGTELHDLMWAIASPWAPLLLGGVQGLRPKSYWSTVGGAAKFAAALECEEAASRDLNRTRVAALRRIRKQTLVVRQMASIRCSEMLWAALAVKVTAQYPRESTAQIWVLVRDEFRELFDQLRVVQADGR